MENIINEEYEQLFPFEQEYKLWIESIERDFREESQKRTGIVVPKRHTFTFTEEDFSPFNTLNS